MSNSEYNANAGETKKTRGFASLLNDETEFSAIAAIGGVRGMVESLLPSLVFIVAFLITRNVQLTVIISGVEAVLQLAVRIVQRQKTMGALSGLIAIAICLIWAWRSNQARNYYVVSFITNAFSAVLFIVLLIVGIPAIGVIVEYFRSMPTRNFKAWYSDWKSDKKLVRVYRYATIVWICVYLIRLVIQLPLYWANYVVVLGIVKLVLGLPLWALAMWISYLVVGTDVVRRQHELRKRREEESHVLLEKEKLE